MGMSDKVRISPSFIRIFLMSINKTSEAKEKFSTRRLAIPSSLEPVPNLLDDV